MTGPNEARAALERGRRVVLVAPPAPEQVGMVWDLVDGLTAIVCADRAGALDWAAAAPPHTRVHPVTGLARAARLLTEGAVDVLAGSLDDLAHLTSRTALKPGTLRTVVVAWPEGMITTPARESLDTFLGAAGEARRVFLSWNPSDLRDFLERHAFKTPVIGDLPLDDTARPLPAVAPARYAVTGPDGRLAAIRGALDVLDPARACVWTPTTEHAERLRAMVGTGDAGRETGVTVATDVPGDPVDLVICARVPSREQLAGLSTRGPVLLLVTPSQLGYARFIAAPLTVVRLPGAADRAADAAEVLRRGIAARLEAGGVEAELMLLEPLFERFDPAEVAAALYALGRATGEEGRISAPPPAAAWVKLFINVGKKDRAGPKDLVGALIKEVGMQKADLGRIELRDTFSTVEVAAGVAEEVIRKLAGVTIRGRRVQAKVDRER